MDHHIISFVLFTAEVFIIYSLRHQGKDAIILAFTWLLFGHTAFQMCMKRYELNQWWSMLIVPLGVCSMMWALTFGKQPIGANAEQEGVEDAEHG
jgi:hypothetical protein